MLLSPQGSLSNQSFQLFTEIFNINKWHKVQLKQLCLSFKQLCLSTQVWLINMQSAIKSCKIVMQFDLDNQCQKYIMNQQYDSKEMRNWDDPVPDLINLKTLFENLNLKVKSNRNISRNYKLRLVKKSKQDQFNASKAKQYSQYQQKQHLKSQYAQLPKTQRKNCIYSALLLPNIDSFFNPIKDVFTKKTYEKYSKNSKFYRTSSKISTKRKSSSLDVVSYKKQLKPYESQRQLQKALKNLIKKEASQPRYAKLLKVKTK